MSWRVELARIQTIARLTMLEMFDIQTDVTVEWLYEDSKLALTVKSGGNIIGCTGSGTWVSSMPDLTLNTQPTKLLPSPKMTVIMMCCDDGHYGSDDEDDDVSQVSLEQISQDLYNRQMRQEEEDRNLQQVGSLISTPSHRMSVSIRVYVYLPSSWSMHSAIFATNPSRCHQQRRMSLVTSQT